MKKRTGSDIRLNLEICERCLKANKAERVYKGLTWINYLHENRMVWCPNKYNNESCASIFEDPPKWCPYILEHTVSKVDLKEFDVDAFCERKRKIK